jgi:hypothetical protein
MKRFDQMWAELISLARQHRDLDAAVPYGFATRLAAQAMTLPAPSPWAGFERFALRGLVVAAVFGVAAIAFNYSSLLSDQTDELATTDTVGEMLELS